MKKKTKKIEEETSSVYVFYNVITKVMLFVYAFTGDEAIHKFDGCNFLWRKHWKVFLEIGHQPD